MVFIKLRSYKLHIPTHSYCEIWSKKVLIAACNGQYNIDMTIFRKSTRLQYSLSLMDKIVMKIISILVNIEN